MYIVVIIGRNVVKNATDVIQKTELLDEMFALQQEIVSLTFNQEHAALAELRMNYLISL